MTSPFDIFDKIANTRGINAKQDLLKTLTPLQKRLFEYALDPYKHFNVTKSSIVAHPHNEASDDLAAGALLSLLDLLSDRVITGKEAIDKVNSMFRGFSDLAFTWGCAILDKNLRIGVDVKSYLKVYPGAFKTFEVQLCGKYEEQSIVGWLAQPKADGIRTVAIPTGDGFTFLSRNGKALFNLDHLSKQLSVLGKFVYDGEIIGGSFEETASKARNQSNKSTDIKYHVFDALTLDEWMSRNTPDLTSRTIRLSKLFVDADTKLTKDLEIFQTYIITATGDHSPNSLVKRFINEGWEGVIYKNPYSKYTWKRDGSWLKHKIFHTVDVPIVGAIQGKGKYANILGALIIEHNGVTSECGTGLDDQQRQELWELHKKSELIGRMVEVSYQNLTPDEGKMRFPVYLKMRPDKD
jgi:DNA ligase-1